jgi:8-oxo-dGTP pyrophosphatase MutT (NUDIX family)
MTPVDTTPVKEFVYLGLAESAAPSRVGPVALGSAGHPLADAFPAPASARRRSAALIVDQGGAVPFRHTPEGRVEICLITSSAGLWSLPKGGIDPGRCAEQTAMIESFEEAGLIGVVIDDALGIWRYVKRGRTRHVAFFPMRVDHEIDDWDEATHRKRRWVDAATAHHQLERPGLDTVVFAFHRWLAAIAV